MAEKKDQVAKAPATDKAVKAPAAPAPAGKAAPKADKAAAAPKKDNAKSAPAAKLGKPRLKTAYEKDVVPVLMKHFKFDNINRVPRLVKVTLNMGLGDIKENSKSVQLAAEEMKTIAGQKPLLTKAKKSVANFKVREGMVVGCKVTLRGVKMWEFLDKFMNIALPRVRDFRGVPADSFDGRGNYALGIKEQLIFPEISYEKIEKIRGMDICITTTAQTDEEARELLKALGMPFKAS